MKKNAPTPDSDAPEPPVNADDVRIYAAVALLGIVMREPRPIWNARSAAEEAALIGRQMAQVIARDGG